MNRNIEIRLDISHGIATLLPGLPPAALWSCDVDRTLLLIGVLTSPPHFKGFSLSQYWAWLRYRIALSPVGDLRLRPDWQEIDSHQKTILSDDFGTGFPCHYLKEMHGFEEFADTKYLVKNVLAKFVSLLGSDLRGPTKSPDFIAVDSGGFLHVVECKGTQTSRKYLGEAIARGIPQKNNLSNPGLFKSCMVGGIFVPQHKSIEHAEIVFADPPLSELAKRLAELGSDAVGAGVRRIGLAKQLGMAGLWAAAAAISDEVVAAESVRFLRNIATGELAYAGYKKDPDSGNWRRTLEFLTLESDGKFPAVDFPVKTIITTLLPVTIEKLFHVAVNDNGSVNRQEIDTWVAEQLLLTRTQRNVTEKQLVRMEEDGKTKTVLRHRRRRVESSWQEVGTLDTPRGWRTGCGITFLIERTEIRRG